MMNIDDEKMIVLNKCIHFLNSIGIPTIFRKIESGSFLPGLLIENGSLVIDNDALLYPGDILHEAGHIAVVPAVDRASMNHQSIMNSATREVEEMMAIAWSYAVCVHLEIDPLIVFHESGYKGGGQSLVENFNEGRFLATPVLHLYNMAIEPARAKPGEEAYPKMLRWMRE